ncbi:hypothetical protein CSHISOI_00436 [Colletotrichum shisoi]|uniref:Uncharacterized protein n=1 Tax=Colletotrichum shisoi TaxID=2078593 RepID=A0A5Q4C8M1_9PEZI|nr:hypothetical protein CSHISOI_00436 [Colletotrichum shisoi]
MSTSSQSHVAAITQTVNALLLRTFALLQTPLSVLKLHRALNSADQALATASHFHRFDLEARAHLYRGHVLRAWGRWRAAHAAYVRAASARGLGFSDADIRSLTRDCIEMIRFEDEREERLRRAHRAANAKHGTEGTKVVRFSDEQRTLAVLQHHNDDNESTRSGESAGEKYLILDSDGEVVETMAGTKLPSNPTQGGDVRKTDGDDNDKPVSSGFGGDVSSTTGPETPHFPDNGAGSAPEPGKGQSTISPTGKAATEEDTAGWAKGATDTLPRRKSRQQDAHAGLDRTTASQSENYSAWYPPGGASSLQSALTDDITASSPQTGAGREDLRSDNHPGNSGVVFDAEIISPLSLSHSPGAGVGVRAGATSPGPHGGGARPAVEDLSPEYPAFAFGRRNAGLTNFPDLAPHADPGPLSPVSHPPGALGTGGRRGITGRPRRVASGGLWGEGESVSVDITDGPAFGAQRRREEDAEAPGVQGGEYPLSEDPWPTQADASSTTTIQTPVPTRPARLESWMSSGFAPAPLRPNQPYPSSNPSPRQQQSQSSSPQTAIPIINGSSFRPVPALLAYENEPPRAGRGFDSRRARAPPPGSSARTHLFVRPQFLPRGIIEHAEIIAAYNKAFEATPETTKMLLGARHRYPNYARDEAARYRKLEFEAETGESMSNEAYYALFDLETANDGMISALLEWMQGRKWVKVPFVNRILHQVCRLMFTSAQEEARLRLRFRRDCDALRDEVEAADEEIKMERMENSWQRMDAAMKRLHRLVTENSDEFRAKPEVLYYCTMDAGKWGLLSHQFTSLLRTRKDIENAIKERGEALMEDLGHLELVHNKLAANDGETRDYLRLRKEKTQDPKAFLSDHQKLLEEARRTDEEINLEEGVRHATTSKFLEAAAHRRSRRGQSAVATDEEAVTSLHPPSFLVFPSPQMLDSREVQSMPPDPVPVPSDHVSTGGPVESGPDVFRPFRTNLTNPVTPGPPDSSRVPADPPADPFPSRPGQLAPERRPQFSNPWHDAELVRPRGPCTRCQTLEQEIKAKQDEIDKGRSMNAVRLAEMEQLKKAIKAFGNKNLEETFKQLDVYQDMVRMEMRQDLEFALPALEMHGRRAYDHTNALETSLCYWQTGGSTKNLLTELEPMVRSVKRLANAFDDLRFQVIGQLKQVDAKKEGRLSLLDENARLNRLVQTLEKEVEGSKSQAMQSLQSRTDAKLDLARTTHEKLVAENDQLKKRIQDCRKQLSDLESGIGKQEADDFQAVNTGAQEEAVGNLRKKEAELIELKARNKTLEEQLAAARVELDVLSKGREERAGARNPEKHDEDLQAEAKAEAAKLKWTSRPKIYDSNSGSQHSDKITQLRADMLDALSRAGLKPYESLNSEAKRALPSLAQSVLWPKKPLATNQTPEEGLRAIWRLTAFSRKRKDVVAALKRGDVDRASERLKHLQMWDEEVGPWQNEDQGAEVRRTINFLSSYTNLELGKVEGFGPGSSERRYAAQTLFDQAVSSGGKETQASWSHLRQHLGNCLRSGKEEEPVCDCKYKPRICLKHRREGGGRYHNFMEVDDPQQAEMELPQEAINSLRDHAIVM